VRYRIIAPSSIYVLYWSHRSIVRFRISQRPRYRWAPSVPSIREVRIRLTQRSRISFLPSKRSPGRHRRRIFSRFGNMSIGNTGTSAGCIQQGLDAFRTQAGALLYRQRCLEKVRHCPEKDLLDATSGIPVLPMLILPTAEYPCRLMSAGRRFEGKKRSWLVGVR